jgi:hypothetical protein
MATGTGDQLAHLLQPSVFAVSCERLELDIFAEPCGLPAIRVATHGSRTIVMAPSAGLLKCAKAIDPNLDEKTWDLDAAQAWFQSSLPQVVEKYTQSAGLLYFGNVGPGDVLFIPHGYLTFERYHKTDILGVRFSMLPCSRPRFERTFVGERV